MRRGEGQVTAASSPIPRGVRWFSPPRHSRSGGQSLATYLLTYRAPRRRQEPTYLLFGTSGIELRRSKKHQTLGATVCVPSEGVQSGDGKFDKGRNICTHEVHTRVRYLTDMWHTSQCVPKDEGNRLGGRGPCTGAQSSHTHSGHAHDTLRTRLTTSSPAPRSPRAPPPSCQLQGPE